MVSNSSSRSKGHRGKSFRCNICWAYREKFGPECQLNFLLSTACCRNSVAEGRRERYCFLYSFMTPGILYQSNRTALGRFVALGSAWRFQGPQRCYLPGQMSSLNKAGNRVKRWKAKTGTKIRLQKTAGFLMSLLIHVSSSTWLEMSDAVSWEMLIFHWVCVVVNGVFSRYVRSNGFRKTAGFSKE